MDNLDTKETLAEILNAESSDEADKNLSQTRTTEIVSMISFRPSDMLFDNSKISHISFNPSKQAPLYEGELMQLAMERKSSKKPISALVAISFDFDKMKLDGVSILGASELTPFDRMVLDAINTLHIEGENEYITLNMIYHVMSGDYKKHVSDNYAREINNSITKLMYSHIVIKATNEAIMYPKLKDFIYDSSLLPAERVTATLNGAEVACIHIDRIPPLFDYASRKNQICRININLLRAPIKNDKRETLKYMTLVFYLLRRIISIRSTSNSILYDTMYRDLGYDKETRKVKLGIRKRAKDILDGWTDTTFGSIKITSYEELRDGNAPYKLVINYEITDTEEMLPDKTRKKK